MSINNEFSFPPESPEPAGSAPAAREFAAGGASLALPPDLRAPWGWLDLVVLAVLAIVGSLLLRLLLSTAFAVFGVKSTQLSTSPSATGLFTIFLQAMLSLILLGYLTAQIRKAFGLPFWRTIGWRAFESDHVPGVLRYFGFIAGGFLLAAAVEFLSVAFGNHTKVPMQALFQDRRTAILLLLMSVFFAPVVEETIFRGYIYPVVARSFGMSTGVLATGILFGLLHAPQLWGGWAQIALLVGVGIIFTYARAVARTVLASYLLHVSYNFFVSFAFLLGSHWLRLVSSSH
jgi:membrane protease YdiL (CAAX protease family)